MRAAGRRQPFEGLVRQSLDGRVELFPETGLRHTQPHARKRPRGKLRRAATAELVPAD